MAFQWGCGPIFFGIVVTARGGVPAWIARLLQH
jgi:hypothetical protein